MSDTLPNEVREAICAEIEEALCGISVGEDADCMSYGLIDAIAEARHETDLKGAGDILRDASADILDAALSALEAAGFEVNRKGTLNNVRAELTARAKEMQSARDTLIWVRDELEDEGDRVYFGSTNHAEQFREAVESMDEWSWHDIMRASRDTDYIGQGRIAAQKRDDLAMLVRRIIYRHSKELPLDEVLAAADDYLARNQLNGSPLRDEPALTASNPKEKPMGSPQAIVAE